MNIYIDMDGVIVKYERAAYQGDDPQFLRPGLHYFRHLNPDVRMIHVVKRLQEETNHRINILTCVYNQGSMFLEQANDKKEWLDEHCPFLQTDKQLMVVSSEKRLLVEFIKATDGKRRIAGHILTADDILIDDYNNNLWDWQNSGGTAVKYINGINDPASFRGINLDLAMTSDQIFDLITRYLDFKNNFTQKEERKDQKI